MCTVSWCLNSEKRHILINRDERKSRVPANPPQKSSAQGIASLMPIDPQGGGSWTAVNEQGFVFCLLNNYRHPGSTEQNRESRGQLVKALSHCATWSEVDAHLQQTRLKPFNPFILLVFDRFNEPAQFSWDGKYLQHKLVVSSPVSSSSLAPRFSPWLRRQWSRTALPQKTDIADLKTLHSAATKVFRPVAIAMQRRQVETVSVTHIEMSSDTASMGYWPGYPDELKEEQGEKTSLTLSHQRFPQPCQSRVSIRQLLQRYEPQLAQSFNQVKWKALEWVCAEKKLNRALTRFDNISPQQFADAALQFLGVEPSVHAFRWPDASARPVFMCNHPTGGIDGLITISALQKRYPKLQVIANDALLQLPHLAGSIMPVKVFANRKHSVAATKEAFASDAPLLVFPAGKTARYHGNGELDDADWAKSMARLSRHYQRCVVPMFIQSRNSSLFYCIHRMRRMLKIDTNLEMLLLPREALKPGVKQPQLFIDLPMRAAELEACGSNDQQRIQWCKTRSYELPKHFKEVVHDLRRPACSGRAKP